MLRITRSTLVMLASTTLLAALGTGVVACSTDESSAALAGSTGETPEDGTSSGGGFNSPKPISDGGVNTSVRYRGNPLCNTAQADSCMPDDDGKACASPSSDADTAPETPDTRSCRLSKSEDGGIIPSCFAESTLDATDGIKCDHGRDCAPGYDCVASEKGTKTCRHYCCAGTCSGNLANGSATFCDVQSLVDVNQKAPVCMPLKRCSALLGSGECASSETCTVVTENGDTGCVAVGDRQVGESCDESHCAADLACLGQPGARKCFKLCKVAANDCPSPQTCVTSAAFKDGQFGICSGY